MKYIYYLLYKSFHMLEIPHNLYLHSGIVQTRAFGKTFPEKKEALKFITIDSTIALMFAFMINASILILAAATFHKTGQTNVTELEDPWQAFARTHTINTVVPGVVTKLVPFGAFIRVHEGIEGLVHISELAERHVEIPQPVS